MLETNSLLELCKTLAKQVGSSLAARLDQTHKTYRYSPDNPREIKALADLILEKDILQALRPLGFPILSEESGYLSGTKNDGYWFIVDPLDGTFNFVKGSGPSAVSIAFWKENTPIFGVVYSLADNRLYWGGPNGGAYMDDMPLRVSETLTLQEASIGTGFPARFSFDNEQATRKFWKSIRSFAKVRMVGSAVASLAWVAKGALDVYAEQNIMLWDVAGGLAILEGAGGIFEIEATEIKWSYNVRGANPHLFSVFKKEVL